MRPQPQSPNVSSRDNAPVVETSGRRVESGTFYAVRPASQSEVADRDEAAVSERQAQACIDAFFDGYESVFAIDSSRAA